MRIAGKGHTANQYCKPTTAAIIRQTEQQVRSWSIEHCGDEAPSNDDEMDVLLPHMMSAELPTPVHSLISLGAAMVPACLQLLPHCTQRRQTNGGWLQTDEKKLSQA